MPARIITAAAVAALALGLVAGPAAARAAKFEGTVVSKNRVAKTFKLRRQHVRGTIVFKVTRRTTYERLAGFGALRAGRRISVVAHRNRRGRWIATRVERSGRTGGGGGRGGADDGPNHA